MDRETAARDLAKIVYLLQTLLDFIGVEKDPNEIIGVLEIMVMVMGEIEFAIDNYPVSSQGD